MATFKDFLYLIIDVLIKPLKTSIKIKEEEYLTWALFTLLIWELLNFIAYSGILTGLNQPTNLLITLWNIVNVFLAFSLSINIFANILGGKGKYIHAFQIFIFFNIPLIMFLIIRLPFMIINLYIESYYTNLILQVFNRIELIFIIWVIILIIIGIKHIYQLTFGRTIVVFLAYYFLMLISYVIFHFLGLTPGLSSAFMF